MTRKNFVMGGEAVEGDGVGALAGWRGQGTMTLGDIVAAVEGAGLPTHLAPREKSYKAQAGHAVRRLDNRGYVVRSAARSHAVKLSKIAGTRCWDARWAVSASNAATADVGDASGAVVATFELWGHELRGTGDTGLVAEVTEIFDALRDAKTFQAGEVTSWLAGILCGHFGATRYSIGYYIPAGQRAAVNALCASLMARGWGREWAVPLLPVGTGDELRIGIMRGFSDDIEGIARSVAAAAAEATAEGRPSMTAGRAAGFLVSLGEAEERLAAYSELCGAERVAPVRATLRAMRDELRPLTNATAMRGAMIELDVEPVAAPAPAVDPVAQAQAAVAARRADILAAEAITEEQNADRLSAIPGAGAFRVPMPPAEEAPRSPLGSPRAPLDMD